VPEPGDGATVDAPSQGDAPLIGQFCRPSAEDQPYFSGFEMVEVALETQAPQCPSGICLVNHFQGRTTCPYGQSDAEAKGGGARAESELCHLTSGVAAARVAVAVAPQRIGRRPADAVYCSCRCAGADPSATYCSCGPQFQCVELAPLFPGHDPHDPYAGSYCIKSGTAYGAATDYGGPCQPGDAGELPCGSYDGR
jgi:hypothetical protein